MTFQEGINSQQFVRARTDVIINTISSTDGRTHETLDWYHVTALKRPGTLRIFFSFRKNGQEEGRWVEGRISVATQTSKNSPRAATRGVQRYTRSPLIPGSPSSRLAVSQSNHHYPRPEGLCGNQDTSVTL
ncbi:hypothetical protein BgiBS90_009415 [Biomphalaria glabrata]|nr:hypothetical protein BgiBS90_009415 [Biomphalaria glabrata]